MEDDFFSETELNIISELRNTLNATLDKREAASAHFSLARVYCKSILWDNFKNDQYFDLVIDHLSNCLELIPNYLRARNLMAFCLLLKEEPLKALTFLDKSAFSSWVTFIKPPEFSKINALGLWKDIFQFEYADSERMALEAIAYMCLGETKIGDLRLRESYGSKYSSVLSLPPLSPFLYLKKLNIRMEEKLIIDIKFLLLKFRGLDPAYIDIILSNNSMDDDELHSV